VLISSSNAAKPILLVAAFLVLLVGAGCSVVSGGTQTPSDPPDGTTALAGGRSVGNLTIALDKENLPYDVTSVAEEYEVTRILGNRVREHLEARGAMANGSLDVTVKIVGMRLRSNGTAIWWGFFAGGDWITVDVVVSENGTEVNRFQTGTSTVLGGMIYGGRSTRIGRMMKTLGERVARGV
jgi:hypothetical protein